MNVLCIALFLPMPDRQTGMLRFFQILRALAERHHVKFCAVALEYQERTYGASEVERYRNNLASIGIEARCVTSHELWLLLRREKFGAVFFEHYDMVRGVDVNELRFWQPQARVIVDTVDVEFQRLMSRADVTKTEEDRRKAIEVRRIELETYKKADIVITTSHPDKLLLEKERLRTRIEVIPLIYDIPALKDGSVKEPPSLMFVGNFGLDANVDAMTYFVREIFPIIVAEVPQVRLVIAGNAPTAELRKLASHNIEVLGYVPDLIPIYERCAISIVPLRWGGGLKGKVVEAMSLGLPVVASDKGLEGFGLEPGENVMLGDTPKSFAAAVIRLIRDRQLFNRIRTNAWQFVNENFSDVIVGSKVHSIFDGMPSYRVKRVPWMQRSRRNARLFLERHLLWRFAQARRGKADTSLN